ncbi:hypothetical protein ADU00_24535 [Salmonella enterica subsp. enterica]|nr:hypothetical protein [Salmonella enterica subsp. enterica serovar Hvittingfoss]
MSSSIFFLFIRLLLCIVTSVTIFFDYIYFELKFIFLFRNGMIDLMSFHYDFYDVFAGGGEKRFCFFHYYSGY